MIPIIAITSFLGGVVVAYFAARPLLKIWAARAVDTERKKKRVYESIGPDYRVLIRAKLESYSLRADGAIAAIVVTDSTKDTTILHVRVPNEVIGKFPAGSELLFELVLQK